jgi:hypothetical protein
VVAVAAAVVAAAMPVQFAPRPRWHTGATRSRACVGVPPSRCTSATAWAATTPWRDCAQCLPHRTVAALRPSGIAIQVTLIWEHPLVAKDRLVWPPRVRAPDVNGPFEGLPRRIGVYQRFARVGRHEVYVWVFFGRSRPTRSQLARANRELAAAQLRA